jgi:hypothetical protein
MRILRMRVSRLEKKMEKSVFEKLASHLRGHVPEALLREQFEQVENAGAVLTKLVEFLEQPRGWRATGLIGHLDDAGWYAGPLRATRAEAEQDVHGSLSLDLEVIPIHAGEGRIFSLAEVPAGGYAPN